MLGDEGTVYGRSKWIQGPTGQEAPSFWAVPSQIDLPPERKEELKALREEAERLDKAQLVDWLMDELEHGMRLQLQLEGGAC